MQDEAGIFRTVTLEPVLTFCALGHVPSVLETHVHVRLLPAIVGPPVGANCVAFTVIVPLPDDCVVRIMKFTVKGVAVVKLLKVGPLSVKLRVEGLTVILATGTT